MSSNGRSERAETFDIHLGQNSLAAGVQGSPTNSEQRDVRNDVKSAETLGIKTKLKVLNPYEYFFEKRKNRLAENKKIKMQKSKDEAFFSTKDLLYDKEIDTPVTEDSGAKTVVSETNEPLISPKVAAVSLSSALAQKRESSSFVSDENTKERKATPDALPEEETQPLFGFNVREEQAPVLEGKNEEIVSPENGQETVDTKEMPEAEKEMPLDTSIQGNVEKKESSPEERELAQLQDHLLTLKNSLITSRLVIENALLGLQQMDEEIEALSTRIEALEKKRITSDSEKTK